jgi:FkbM family methyltransferase
MNFTKIIRRIKWFIKSIPNLILAIIFEFKKHPWEYIFDFLTLSAEKRYSKTDHYIEKYFKLSKDGEERILERNDFKISIPEYLLKNDSFMLGILFVFFDIIYPNQTKYPIPFIITEGNYEKYGVRVNKDDYIIDAGANIGMFSTYYSNKVGNNGKIFAFEPIPKIYEILVNQNKRLKYKNVVNIMGGLYKTIGKTTFNYSEENMGGSTHNSKGDSIEVMMDTIDNFVKINNIPKINLIKMDIEGAERNALIGATETIKKYKPKLSICIYHLPDDPEVIKNIITNIRSDYKYKMTDYKIYAW